METIELIDGRTVYKKDYIEAKTLDLIDFGYASLMTKDVEEQLDKVLNNESNLSVIGHFISKDINK